MVGKFVDGVIVVIFIEFGFEVFFVILMCLVSEKERKWYEGIWFKVCYWKWVYRSGLECCGKFRIYWWWVGVYGIFCWCIFCIGVKDVVGS